MQLNLLDFSQLQNFACKNFSCELNIFKFVILWERNFVYDVWPPTNRDSLYKFVAQIRQTIFFCRDNCTSMFSLTSTKLIAFWNETLSPLQKFNADLYLLTQDSICIRRLLYSPRGAALGCGATGRSALRV